MSYGKIVYEDNNQVIRLEEEADSVTIKVHVKVKGEEHRPNAYMIGFNYLKVEKGR